MPQFICTPFYGAFGFSFSEVPSDKERSVCVFVKIKVKSTRSILLQKQLGRRIEIIRDIVYNNKFQTIILLHLSLYIFYK